MLSLLSPTPLPVPHRPQGFLPGSQRPSHSVSPAPSRPRPSGLPESSASAFREAGLLGLAAGPLWALCTPSFNVSGGRVSTGGWILRPWWVAGGFWALQMRFWPVAGPLPSACALTRQPICSPADGLWPCAPPGGGWGLQAASCGTLGHPTLSLLPLTLSGLVLLPSILLLYLDPAGVVSATSLERNVLSPRFSLPSPASWVFREWRKSFRAVSLCPQTRPWALRASGKVKAYRAWAIAGRWRAPVSSRPAVRRGERGAGGGGGGEAEADMGFPFTCSHVWHYHLRLFSFAKSQGATLLE